jgi:hypothetical protein
MRADIISPRHLMRWFRVWTDVLDDPKLLLLDPADRWYFLAVCALKCTGLLDEPDSNDLRDTKIALRMRLEGRERDRLKHRLIEARLIDENWQPLGWQQRQYPSDPDPTNRERQRRFRERRKSANASVTPLANGPHNTVTNARYDPVTNGSVTATRNGLEQNRTEQSRADKRGGNQPLGNIGFPPQENQTGGVKRGELERARASACEGAASAPDPESEPTRALKEIQDLTQAKTVRS